MRILLIIGICCICLLGKAATTNYLESINAAANQIQTNTETLLSSGHYTNIVTKGYIQPTNGMLFQVKMFFTTNYTCIVSDAVLLCGGTNQYIVLPDATNLAALGIYGKSLEIICATNTGSVIVTNANGVQKVLGSLSQVVGPTNKTRFYSDGINWY